VMKEYLAQCRVSEGVLFIGKAQEKARVFRTIRKKNPQTGKSYPWITREPFAVFLTI
jgi:lysine/ornithine N-monooxygenase